MKVETIEQAARLARGNPWGRETDDVFIVDRGPVTDDQVLVVSKATGKVSLETVRADQPDPYAGARPVGSNPKALKF